MTEELQTTGCRVENGNFICIFRLDRTSSHFDEPDSYGEWVDKGVKQELLAKRDRELKTKYPGFNVVAIIQKEDINQAWLESRIKFEKLKELIDFINSLDSPVVLSGHNMEIYDDYRE